jgi:hypothetical protein
MALEIRLLDNANENAWDELVNNSAHSTLFHCRKWLHLAEEQSHAELLPCMIYKGTQLIAIYPIFLQQKGPALLALSPPSRAYMLYLGPVIADYESLKQDKKESTFIQIQEAIDNYIFITKRCRYARIRSSPGLYDSRPLRWAGYTVEPFYTYRIDLSRGTSELWKRFDRKLRVEINKTIRDGVTIRTGDKNDLEYIYDSLAARYRHQGIQPVDYKKYLVCLYDTFSEENMKIFVAEYNNERIGGTINLCFKNVMYLWVGIPKSDLIGISPNALIQWEAMKWACEHGFKYYEEMDSGDDPRLRYFKSKFNPDLLIWFSATKYSSHVYKAGEKIFQLLKKGHGR